MSGRDLGSDSTAVAKCRSLSPAPVQANGVCSCPPVTVVDSGSPRMSTQVAILMCHSLN